MQHNDKDLIIVGECILFCSGGMVVVPEEDVIPLARKNNLKDSYDASIKTVDQNDGPDNVTVLPVARS